MRVMGGAGFWTAVFLVISGCDASVEHHSTEHDETGAPSGVKSWSDSAMLNASDGESRVAVSLAQLVREIGVRHIQSHDPHYEQEKKYSVLPCGNVVLALFSLPQEVLKESTFLLEATDGYSVRLPGDLLFHPSAFIAIADDENSDFLPIGTRGVNPGPFYLVWEGKQFSDEKKYPRPWALARIVRLSPKDAYEHIQPSGGFGDNTVAARGFELFAGECIRCHSINQEGAKLGPDLNVPQNILDYRPEEQVRAYIKNPQFFRYGAMPAHPGLSSSDLDALIEYLRFMKGHQFDPHQPPPLTARGEK